jgi:hypothetical protein
MRSRDSGPTSLGRDFAAQESEPKSFEKAAWRLFCPLKAGHLDSRRGHSSFPATERYVAVHCKADPHHRPGRWLGAGVAKMSTSR